MLEGYLCAKTDNCGPCKYALFCFVKKQKQNRNHLSRAHKRSYKMYRGNVFSSSLQSTIRWHASDCALRMRQVFLSLSFSYVFVAFCVPAMYCTKICYAYFAALNTCRKLDAFLVYRSYYTDLKPGHCGLRRKLLLKQGELALLSGNCAVAGLKLVAVVCETLFELIFLNTLYSVSIVRIVVFRMWQG